MNEKTIFSFLDSKFPDSFEVRAHSVNEGISAFVFDLNHNDEFVARVIRYRELPTPYVVVGGSLLSDLNRWFEVGPHRGEKIFESWLKTKKFI